MSSAGIEAGPPPPPARRKYPTVEKKQDAITAALRSGADAELKPLLESTRPADLAELMERLRPDDRLRLLSFLDDRHAALVLRALHRGMLAAELLQRIPQEKASEYLRWIPAHERAAILGRLGKELRDLFLGKMDPGIAEDVRKSLAWPPRTAGRLLQTKVVRLSAEMTADSALARVRELNAQVEQANDGYVLDAQGVLVGIVSVRELLNSPPDSVIGDWMSRDLITVLPTENEEQVAHLISKYDFLSVPVVDAGCVFLGIVTIDDAVDVLYEEYSRNLLSLGAIQGDQLAAQSYFTLDISRVVRSRISWLLLLFVAETATGTVLRHFEDELAKVVALSFFIPLLIGTGGNAGSQTVSTIIRALALGEVRLSDWMRVVARESLTGLILGVILGSVAFGRALLWHTSVSVASAVSISILVICIWANTVGALVPILAERVGVDPTVVSAPLITTLVDATGLFIYLKVAGMILGL